ncbi:MAG: lamin tail domain-containing protein [Candidatus Pacebacteria bacterium]|nr:lamin tail domain-containing protein [Candidatus Paceibacterota bacterium]
MKKILKFKINKTLISISKIALISFGLFIFFGVSQAFASEIPVPNNVFSAGCWEKPTTPALLSPENGYIVTSSSDQWFLNPVMDWADSAPNCPLSKDIQYKYESYHSYIDGELSDLAYESEFLKEPKITLPQDQTSDGDYYWRVRAYDGYTWSDWSEVWLLRIDTKTLFFSEYIEGSSNNKALEIYNPKNSEIDLGAEGYKVEMYFNESSFAGLTINLSGTVASGDVFVLTRRDAHLDILAQADQIQDTTAGWYNGDDAVVLKQGDKIIDVIGQVGFDPGSEWGSGLTSTQDNTLVRKCGITSGDTDGSDSFDPSVEWEGYGVDTFSHLGSHTLTCPTEEEVLPPPEESPIEEENVSLQIKSPDLQNTNAVQNPEDKTLLDKEKESIPEENQDLSDGKDEDIPEDKINVPEEEKPDEEIVEDEKNSEESEQFLKENLLEEEIIKKE